MNTAETGALKASACMNLLYWSSKSADVTEAATDDNVMDPDDVTIALGPHWRSDTDMLSFAKRKIPKIIRVTKRTAGNKNLTFLTHLDCWAQ